MLATTSPSAPATSFRGIATKQDIINLLDAVLNVPGATVDIFASDITGIDVEDLVEQWVATKVADEYDLTVDSRTLGTEPPYRALHVGNGIAVIITVYLSVRS